MSFLFGKSLNGFFALTEFEDIFINGTLQFDNWEIQEDNDTNDLQFILNDNVEHVFQGSTAFVGINTDNPQVPLHVNGQGFFNSLGIGSTNLTVNGTTYSHLVRGNTGAVRVGFHNDKGADPDVFFDISNDNNSGELALRFINQSNDGISQIFSSGGEMHLDTSATTTPTSRIVIQNTGNVGIGTNNPTNFFEVHGNSILGSNFVLQVDDSSQEVGINIDPAQNLHVHEPSAAVSNIQITNATATSGALIGVQTSGALHLYNQETAAIEFYTNALERMRIGAGGYVGIGTTVDPIYNLQVHEPTAATSNILLTNASATLGTLLGVQTSGDFYIFNQQNADIEFHTNSSPRMRIFNDGQMEFNTTSFSSVGDFAYQFHGPAAQNTWLHLTNSTTGTTATDGTVIGLGSNDAGLNLDIRNRENSHIALWTNDSERVRITNDGHFVHGTNTDVVSGSTYDHLIYGNSSSAVVGGIHNAYTGTDPDVYWRLTNDNNSGEIFLQFTNLDGNGQAQLIMASGGDLQFHTTPTAGGSERMRIASNGDVGIHTNNPAYDLDIVGDIRGDTSGTLAFGRNPEPGRKMQIQATGSQTCLRLYRTTSTANDNVVELNSDVGGSFSNHLIIQADGDIFNSNGTYGTISDMRLKTNVRQTRDYADDFAKLDFVKFNWDKEGLRRKKWLEESDNKEYMDVDVGDEQHFQKDMFGLIAQQVQDVFPSCISTDDNGYLAIKTSVLHTIQGKVIQELLERIKILENKVLKKSKKIKK